MWMEKDCEKIYKGTKQCWKIFFFFLMWTTSKVFNEFVTTLFLFHVLAFLAMRPVGSHAPPVGSLWEPAAPVLEG